MKQRKSGLDPLAEKIFAAAKKQAKLAPKRDATVAENAKKVEAAVADQEQERKARSEELRRLKAKPSKE
jgi:hypothetical protein